MGKGQAGLARNRVPQALYPGEEEAEEASDTHRFTEMVRGEGTQPAIHWENKGREPIPGDRSQGLRRGGDSDMSLHAEWSL